MCQKYEIRLHRCQGDYLSLRVSLIFVGSILILISLQGIFQIYNSKIQDIQHLKFYCILFMVIGFLLLVVSIFRIQTKNQINYQDLISL